MKLNEILQDFSSERRVAILKTVANASLGDTDGLSIEEFLERELSEEERDAASAVAGYFVGSNKAIA